MLVPHVQSVVVPSAGQVLIVCEGSVRRCRWTSSRNFSPGDHFSPHTSCRCPSSRRSHVCGGVLVSRCMISRSLDPLERMSLFQASAPTRAECPLSLFTFEKRNLGQNGENCVTRNDGGTMRKLSPPAASKCSTSTWNLHNISMYLNRLSNSTIFFVPPTTSSA